MRIAMVANWWYRRGGLGGVMLDEAGWLSALGHEVVPFAAAHPANMAAISAPYFPPFIETSDLGSGQSPIQRLRMARDVIHNPDTARLFGEFLRSFRPDLVHLHGTARQLSPSILATARAAGLPIVMTLHDYGLVCPQGLMFKGGRSPCTAPNCVRGDPVYAVRYRCIKGSVSGSGLGAIEQLVHRSLGWYRRRVQLFVAPSRFLLGLIARSGAVEPGRLRHLPNGLDVGGSPVPVPRVGGHMLYSGRLVPEKGLTVLIEAARRLPTIPFLVAGEGPLRDELARIAPENVSFLGQQDQKQLDRLREQAVAILSPSIWYENAPLTVLEAMRAARPVVATEPGGQAELLSRGGGVLVRIQDAEGLSGAITSLWEDRTLADRVGATGREAFLMSYTAERHVGGLESIYREALSMADEGKCRQPPDPTRHSSAA